MSTLAQLLRTEMERQHLSYGSFEPAVPKSTVRNLVVREGSVPNESTLHALADRLGLPRDTLRRAAAVTAGLAEPDEVHGAARRVLDAMAGLHDDDAWAVADLAVTAARALQAARQAKPAPALKVARRVPVKR